MWTTMRKCGSTARCRAAAAIRARPPSRASTCPTASCSPKPSTPATNSRSRYSASTVRSRSRRRISSSSATPRWSFTSRRRKLSGLRKAIKNFRILDQDAPARCLARRPLAEKIEQPGIVGLGGLVRVRPVAAPQHPFGRGLDIGLADFVDVRVGERAGLARIVGHRQLDPGAALVDEAADNLIGWMLDAGRLRHVPHVIEHDMRRKAIQQRFDGDDLLGVHIELHMQSQRVYALAQSLDYIDGRSRYGRRSAGSRK